MSRLRILLRLFGLYDAISCLIEIITFVPIIWYGMKSCGLWTRGYEPVTQRSTIHNRITEFRMRLLIHLSINKKQRGFLAQVSFGQEQFSVLSTSVFKKAIYHFWFLQTLGSIGYYPQESEIRVWMLKTGLLTLG